jgi:acyl-CoA hydrolase
VSDARTPAASRSVLVHWMGPSDTNNQGTVHGGTLLKLADEVAALVGIRHARHEVVTAGLDRVTFLAPIAQGELVTLHASLNAVWRTSMEVGVRVTAEQPRTGLPPRHTNSAYVTLVALDDDRRPVAVPELRCETADELRREREAQTRRSNRLAEREALLRERAG